MESNMKIEDVQNNENINMDGIPASYYLIGLLSAFENRFQAMADKEMGEISWKQFFLIICMNMCRENPTIKELADIVGSSHQNVKQLLLKLESKGFVRIYVDEHDKRKQRICLTEACLEFCNRNDATSSVIMGKMFAGISEEQLRTTIATITAIEKNMNGINK